MMTENSPPPSLAESRHLGHLAATILGGYLSQLVPKDNAELDELIIESMYAAREIVKRARATS